MIYGDVDIGTLRRQLDIPRDTARALGNEAVRIIGAREYTNPRGNAVDLRRLIEAARAGTVEYDPEKPVPPPTTASRPSTPHVTVRNTTTLAAAHGLLRDGHAPAALNFGSATHPGGGFLSGGRAQEEYLARSSALYACLQGRRMYSQCAGHLDPFAAEFIIVSPDVPVFRDDDGHLLDEPWCCTTLTAPAVQAHGVHKYLPERGGEIEPVMRARIHRLLRVAAAHGHRALVLGGWGCGAFGNDPVMIARLFREALAGELGHYFDEVVFAVADWSDDARFVGPFARAFGSPDALTP